ncbi:MAG: SMI1/KNR4 family protein [Spirochaetes bacterium]|nr:SMI1/KNR4 family protein [Spirochaetota bacterium]
MKNELKKAVKNFGGFMDTIPAKEESVKKIERLFQTALPQDYRTFLLEYGYALPNSENVEFTPIKSSGAFAGSALGCFFGIDIEPVLAAEGGYEDSDLTNVIKEHKDTMPEWCIPIGDDLDDDDHENIICMSLAQETFGHICLWEVEKMPAQAKYSDLHLLANSFYEFLAGLKLGEAPEEAAKPSFFKRLFGGRS